jgi:hypothetical protein
VICEWISPSAQFEITGMLDAIIFCVRAPLVARRWSFIEDLRPLRSNPMPVSGHQIANRCDQKSIVDSDKIWGNDLKSTTEQMTSFVLDSDENSLSFLTDFGLGMVMRQFLSEDSTELEKQV